MKKNKIICFDIDNIICKTINKNYQKSKPIKKVISLINNLYTKGFTIKIFTARHMGKFKGNVQKVNKYGYNKDMIMKVVGNLLCKIRFAPDRNGKKKIVRKMFEALTEKRSILFINDYRKFRSILDKKLKELYYDESWFIPYMWYRRIFGKRLKWEENLNNIP